MAKLFDKANPSIVILILLINVYFTSPLLLLSKNQVRLKRSSPGCTLTLYDDDLGSPRSLTLTTSDSSLADNGWDNIATTAIVSGGCQWILYDTADFEENVSSIIRPSVISPGSYPFSSIPTFGLPNDVLSAVRCLPAEGTPAIILFSDHFYFDQMQVIYSSNPNLALTNFDNMVSSFIITGGTWELYSEANYYGSRVTLGQGHYPTAYFLRPIANDDLTSIRLIVFADCGPPPFLLNGALNYQNTMEGSEVHYHCRDGFTLEGRMTSVCEENGSWNPTPICTPQTADCGPPPVFLNGTVSYQNTTEGSEAHYHCDDGFILEGERTAICRSDGRWNSTPVCRQHTGSANDGNDSDKTMQGIGNTTITAILVLVSCIVSFIIGALVGVVVYYCATRKKPTVTFRERPSTQEFSNFQQAGNVDVNENAAFTYLEH